jgi:alkylation response protein AidB-like acyl-CoA dehydrogenase
MDFEFSEDQGTLRDSVRRLVTHEYTFERRQAFLATPHGSSAGFWRLLAQQGLFSLALPENVGGYGGPREIMLVMEELGRGLVLEPFLSTVVLGAGLIRDHGRVAQQVQLLPKIATGELRLALAHYETGARHVLDPIGTLARRGRGSYVLTGTKAMVLDAPLADMLIVSARDDATGGVSLFMVAPNTPGVGTTPYRTQDGRSAADVVLDEVRLPTAARLGSPGVALTALEQAADCALAALCAEAVGVIEAVNEMTLRHLNTHGSPGHSCGRFLPMVLMATQAKSMSYLATSRCRERDRAERHRILSAAKSFVGKAARFVGQQAVLLHGGTQMSAELAVSHYFKRLMMINASFGDVDHRVGTLGDLLRAES